MSLARALQELTPNSPYSAMLADQFGVEVPESAPMYQKEFLYKYCLQEKYNGTDADVIVAKASIKVEEYIAKNPWTLLKYEQLVEATTPTPKREKKSLSYQDGTVTYNAKNGMHFYYMDSKIVARSNSFEGLKKVVTKKVSATASSLIYVENVVTL